MKNGMGLGLGQRPEQSITVTTRDGKKYDLGKQVQGDDLIAKFYRRQQRRKINAYCKDRLKTLTGDEREQFLLEVEKMKEFCRG